MNIALILAGGTGTRLGASIPKQYLEAGGKPIISYCVEVFASYDSIDYIHIVADSMWHEFIYRNISSDKFKEFSKPGENRQLSIFNGLCDIKKYAVSDDIVIIHDAVRPCISKCLLGKCIAAAEKHDGALPVLPMKDTVYFSENGEKVTSLLNRNKIFAGQAPEAFKLGKYYDANVALLPNDILKINGSTEPAVMANMDIALIAGDENNFKITTKEDFDRFCDELRRR